MTVTELHAALGALIEQGHGELTVEMRVLTKMYDCYHEEIDSAKLATDLEDPERQLIELGWR